MELQAPVKQADQSYIVPIDIESNLRCSYSSRESGRHTTPPDTNEEFQQFLHTLASTYESYAKKWFNTPINALQFLKRLTHKWNFEPHMPYLGSDKTFMIHQIWRPEQFQVYPRSISLQWKLVEVVYGNEHTSGFANVIIDPDTIPFTETEVLNVKMSLRERALRKIREARLKAALTEARAKKLLLRYYEKYATTELMQGDPILSSSEDEYKAPTKK
jgi:hypothetical protein